ncbi:DUF3907 family protein [Bacillus pacificus]
MKIVDLLIQGKTPSFFQQTPPASIEQVMKNLEGKFQLMREELEYYETDYQTKMLHKY